MEGVTPTSASSTSSSNGLTDHGPGDDNVTDTAGVCTFDSYMYITYCDDVLINWDFEQSL